MSILSKISRRSLVGAVAALGLCAGAWAAGLSGAVTPQAGGGVGPTFDAGIGSGGGGIDRALPQINSIRNPTGTGVVAGTPGTLPTNWQWSIAGGGMSKQIVGTGVENGMSYIDFRVFGTYVTNDTIGIYYDFGGQIGAITGQSYTLTHNVKMISGTAFTGNRTFQTAIDEFDIDGNYLATQSGSDQGSSVPASGTVLGANPLSATYTMANAATGSAVPYMFMFLFGAGGAIDFTIRVGVPTLVSNTGLVANRNYIPWGFNSTNKQAMSRSAHFARDTITSLRVVIPNWYVDTTNNGGTYTELGTGAAATITASIEYPAATFTQLKFATLSSGSATNGGNLTSDALAIAIPNGAQFWVRIFFLSAGGILSYTLGDSALGDVATFAVSGLSDQTMSGTISGTAGFSLPPIAILGATTKKSSGSVGTSRTAGTGDTNNGTGDRGVIARSVSPYSGHINGGIPGDSMVTFIAANKKRRQLIRAICTDVWVEHGVNDSGSNDATKQTNAATIYNYFPTKRVRGVTVDPNTTGAWTAPTGSDQTVAQDFTVFNTFIKTRPSPLFGVSDVAPVVSLVSPPTKWKAPGFTADGLHETQAANFAIVAAQAVRF